ncbi:hypothetical protein LF887_16170 [Chryseobacterium sp. MEBOG06]|uniref:hypothetical protein n=1 Tax=unclassified Chryseobacterium TaxID=2593645 RepID=UPI001F451512|nr:MULTISPECIES: hypothetical protein [unclassified Chryseobacterium]UKB82540.1 hypothetical protein LF887_16170 [Chryseobacterium sp. MEBOG06]
MKNITIAVALIFFNISFAQVAIGKQTVDGNSTVLDFDNISGNTKGVILPATSGFPTGSLVNGTFIFDVTDNKIKMYENDLWKSLSDAGDSSSVVANNSSELGKGVVIGNSSSTADGVLVLEAPDKAMILPQVEKPHLNVKNPYPGMICYDTASKTLAVFDGKLWNYWK